MKWNKGKEEKQKEHMEKTETKDINNASSESSTNHTGGTNSKKEEAIEGSANKNGKNKLPSFQKKMKKAASIAAVGIVFILLISAYLYSLVNNKNITVVTTIGSITFTDKQKNGEECYVTFQAADYNLIPDSLNEKGITIKVDGDTYHALALDVDYAYANVVFQIPKSAANKAGYDESSANIQALWNKDILEKYAQIQSIVWSGSY
ncbi:hypothetical protein LJC58_09005 [Lachnospiraceae bacterium OttesenSCG-928-D06]|nr:hypothetical protein [Lachnospiraceae bacterium OttesenSCG-928-D06]